MVQRAVVTQKCMVCGGRSLTKGEMTEHIEQFHGVNWDPAQLTRTADTMEFRPHVSSHSPWGQDLR